MKNEKGLILEIDPFNPNNNKTLESAQFYITDRNKTRWQISWNYDGLVIRTTNGARVKVLPDCANTIQIKVDD